MDNAKQSKPCRKLKIINLHQWLIDSLLRGLIIYLFSITR